MGTRGKLLLALGLLGYRGLAVSAQELRFREYGPDAGLPVGHVFALKQDRAGYLWVGGSAGLFSFDGHEFRRWGLRDGVPGGLVHALRETTDGRLWVVAQRGVAYREPGAHKFQLVDIPIAPHVHLKSLIAATPDGKLLLGDGATLWILSAKAAAPAGVEVGSVAVPAGSTPLRALAVDAQGTAWAACGASLCRLVRTGGNAGRLDVTESGLPPESWTALASGPHGLAVRSSTALWRRKPGVARFHKADEGLGSVANDHADLAFTPEGDLLVTTTRGLAVSPNAVPTLWQTIGTGNGLPTASITAITIDREGAAWLGTSSEPSLVRWDRRAQWEMWTRRQGLEGDVIWGMTRDTSGVLWVAGNGGLFQKKAERFEVVPATGRDFFRKPVAASDGSVWVLVNGTKVRRQTRATHQDYALPDPRLRSLLLDRGRRLWVLGAGLWRTDSDVTQNPVRFSPVAPPGTDASESFAQAALDGQGRVWLTGTNGLAMYDPAADRWQRLGVSDGLASLRLQGVLADSSGSVWVSYRTAAPPTRLHFISGRWQADRMSMPEQMGQALIVGFAEDREKMIWVATEAGIYVWNGTTWRRYGREDGLQSEDCVAGALHVDGDGSVWLGTARGLSRFDGNRVPMGVLPPPGAAFTDFEQDGKTVEFGLRSLSFWRPQDQLFRYRMRGQRFFGSVFDSGWVETRDPEVRYANLPGGRYQVELKTRSSAQAWSSSAAMGAFEMPVSWYASAWFLSSVFTGAPLAGWWWRRRQRLQGVWRREQYRVHVEREVARKTQHLEQARQQAEEANRRKNELLAGLGEQIRRPLHSLTGLVDLALLTAKDEKQRDYLESAQAASSSLLSMAGDLLDYTGTESGRLVLRSEPCALRECVRGVVLTLQAASRWQGRAVYGEVARGVPQLVQCDGQRLRQVLLHLGSSVLGQTPTAGAQVKVELEYATASTAVLLFGVYDPSVAPGTFSPLGVDEIDESGGLELAIAARLVTGMASRLSTHAGDPAGRSFRFSLQLRVAVAEEPREAWRMLLAEDHVVNRRVTAALLEQAGFLVTTVVDGPQTVEQAGASDVLLIDPQTSAMDALETVRSIREAEALSGRARLRIVGLTASDDAGLRRRCEEAGMDSLLTKPIRLEDLLPVMRDAALRSE